MLSLKYVIALWKRKVIGQLISFLYMIPITLVIVSSVLQMITPIISSIFFERNSNYTYMYSCDYYSINNGKLTKSKEAESLLSTANATSFLFKKFFISSKYDTTLMMDNYPYAEINKIDNLYISKAGENLQYGIFSNKNYIEKTINAKPSNIPQIILSYNSAKILEVKKGDMIIIQTSNGYIECLVSGILRPNYEESSETNNWLDYNEMLSFPALLIVNENLYKEIVESNFDISVCTFSNNEIKTSSSAVTILRKDNKLNCYKEILTSKSIVIRFIFQLLLTSAVVIILLALEFNFAHKKNATDIETLGLLGMKRTNLARMLSMHVWISSFFSLLISILICRFIYFDLLIKIYGEPFAFFATWFVLLVIITFTLVVRSLFVKKTT